MFQNDLIIREIEKFSKFVARCLKKEGIQSENQEEVGFTEEDYLFYQLQELLFEGKINEAENVLFEKISQDLKVDYLNVAEKFYSEVYKMSDAYLEKNSYSRDEIYESLDELQMRYEKQAIKEG